MCKKKLINFNKETNFIFNFNSMQSLQQQIFFRPIFMEIQKKIKSLQLLNRKQNIILGKTQKETIRNLQEKIQIIFQTNAIQNFWK